MNLTVNEQLANAMRAVATAKAEMRIFTALEDNNKIKRVNIEPAKELDDILCDAICRIASLSGEDIACRVVDESEEDFDNRLNSMEK